MPMLASASAACLYRFCSFSFVLHVLLFTDCPPPRGFIFCRRRIVYATPLPPPPPFSFDVPSAPPLSFDAARQSVILRRAAEDAMRRPAAADAPYRRKSAAQRRCEDCHILPYHFHHASFIISPSAISFRLLLILLILRFPCFLR